MIYKLKLSRSTEIMKTVDVPLDFSMRKGDILLVDEKYHEIQHIIRPTIPVAPGRKFNNGPTEEEMEKAIPILVIGDSFPLI